MADAIFWIATVAIGLSQLLILRSTWRGMRQGVGSTHPVREWSFAIGPAFVLLLLLAATYQQIHPEVLHLKAVTPAGPRA